MAEADNQRAEGTGGPRVHPAGRLSGAPEPGGEAAEDTPESPSADAEAAVPDAERADASQADAPEDKEESESSRTARRQRKRRKLLRDCERLLLLNFDTLAMPGWPDHHRITMARRRRDLWLLSMAGLAMVGLAGMGNLVPAVVGGTGFGLLVLVFLLGTPPIRGFFSEELSYTELLVKRHQMLREARKHIEHLEGRLGLAWCCRELAEYNEALRRTRFQGLYRLSQEGRLPSSVRSRGHAQLYLMFALEAEKAYTRMRDAYLNTHQAELDAIEHAEESTVDAPYDETSASREEPPESSA